MQGPSSRGIDMNVARKQILSSVACSMGDRKSTRLNSSHSQISYAVFCLKKKHTVLDGIIHTIMAPIHRITIIGRREGCPHRRRLPATQTANINSVGISGSLGTNSIYLMS